MSATAQPTRMRQTLHGAAFTSGAEQVIEFFLPLYAGAALGLSPIETAVLVAATEGFAFLVRPIAGALADRIERTWLAATGALLLAAALVMFALTTGFPLALAAASLVGAGSGLFWVAASSIVAERLRYDSGAFAKLMAAEETGGWVILAPAIMLVSIVGYPWIFAAMAACCVIAAWMFLGIRERREVVPVTESDSEEPARLLRKLLPMLAAVVATMAAEAAIGLLMLLHLQRAFELSVTEIALVFLPGAIAMGVLPPVVHGFVVHFGRRKALIVASLASAAFAVGLAFAPNPIVIAVLWILSAAAWATVLPIQQAVIVEAAGDQRHGRAIGLYEAAVLLGSFIGSLAAGVVYESGSWMLACLVCAVVVASGALLVPSALRRMGAVDVPEPVAAPPATSAAASTQAAPAEIQPAPGTTAPDESVGVKIAVSDAKPKKSRRELMTDLAWHTGLLAAAMTAGVVFLPDVRLGDIFGFGPDAPGGPGIFTAFTEFFRGDGNFATLAASALRVWGIVWLGDCAWTMWKLLSDPQPPSRDDATAPQA